MTYVWRHIAHSLQGPAHAKEDSPCQDAHAVRILGGDSQSALLACVADGAGSSRYSDEGSTIACNTIVDNANAYHEKNRSFEALGYEEIVAWCDDARQRIRSSADVRGCEPREFATTLCVAIISENRSVFFQIGDGAIIVERNGVYGVIFWPQSGEYANTTNFLTSVDFKKHLEFWETKHDFSDLALITDGMERLALIFEMRVPHPPFFLPLFTAIRSDTDAEKLAAELQTFLESESVTSRTDDDKTIVLASQMDEEVRTHD